jgi:hypothetical protein
MKRRTFFKWTLSSSVPFVAPRWAPAQTRPFTREGDATLRELAAVVLPSSLGRNGSDGIVDRFAEWLRGYKAGAEMSTGYGFPRMQAVPANPSAGYAGQLDDLERSARAIGSSFAGLDMTAKRRLVEAALAGVGADRIPARPDGRHVAADIMSFYFHGADGEDVLYAAAIRRNDCRGLPSSGARPGPVR